MRHSKSEGMSLIEVLVAFVILAMTMSVILRINSGAVRNHQVASHYFEAVAIAQSRLEQMSAEVDTDSYSEQGVDLNTYTWTYLRQPYSWNDAKLVALPLIGIEESLKISWDAPGGTRELSFTRIGVIRDKP
ncbi:MAG: prepilin-type N-terminal cleavage/methylation domain-containing protein [Candidatus Thiodiazotropha lotti]|uniref:type IV pilus modification PilV family protein n=1 Tax=Candidatus Thiodiazotropha endoloripes TaxID=1818881 RepID=UPI000903863E|nr:prepilin-type N-terminal cleavage/methylation domain-containing protein [Candidatus Thiodiazotropha endoloripes]MCG7915740.1 prepilin-type N-terminal cleavage/methylation domain-containing protein [Candidatus Thiodiazotropha weberae]MCG7990576.1 prepilin-type N-terminal cleavage/methylation domain-containing protein [Candidatus Thiodiazotropha lotti]MCG8001616.1 prepilin-type N-terminal cleavage/methylation domain-containing protein [Candidatus Thiodiazotropha lotti]MCW4182230.1 prepilin-typ